MIGFSKLPKGYKEGKLNALLVKAAKMLGESQRDGFGVAISHGKQSIYRERHLSASTFNGLGSMHWSVCSLPKGLRTKLKDGVDFDQYGKIPSLANGTGPVVLHGRTATCDKSIKNTHPFVKHDERLGNLWTMAHNGVVSWEAKDTLPLETTCDSEHLLNCYVYLQGEESFKDRISGYAATLGVTPLGELFCFRDNRAPLYICYSQELDISILASDETHAWELMTDLCKLTKTKIAKVGEPVMLDDWTAHTWLVTGEVTSVPVTPFESGYGRISSTYVNKAFGTSGTTYYDAYSRDSWYDARTPSSTSTSSNQSLPGFKEIDDETRRATKSMRSRQEELALADDETIERMIQKVETNPDSYTPSMVEEIKKIKLRKQVSERRRAKLLIDGKREKQPMTREEYNYILYGDSELAIPADTKEIDLDSLSEHEWQKLVDDAERAHQGNA